MMVAMSKKWRVIDTGGNNGFVNMAIDEAIMAGIRQGIAPATVRFYRWNPPAVTIGYFQDIHREIDLAKCTELGVDVVRRLTGGRAVLHHREVTYSMACPEDDPVASGTVVQSYLRISQGLLAGVKSLGVPAELVPHGGQKGAALSAACFEAPSWYELVVDGKKLIGSAQTRKQGIMLQHGSLPLEMDEGLLADIICFSSDLERDIFKRRFSEKAVALNNCLAVPITYEQATAALTQGLEQALKVELVAGDLTDYEQELAQELTNKYKSMEWNHGAGKRKLR
jgi:lipoate-protein ligase A